MSKAIHIVAEIKIKPEFRDALMPVLQELVAGSRMEGGNISYDITEALDTPGRFYAVEIWASEQAIKEHGDTPHFQNFVKAIKDKSEKVEIVKLHNLF